MLSDMAKTTAQEANRRFTAKLATAVAGCGLNKSEVARRADVPGPLLDKYLGGSTPKPATIYRLAKATGVSPVWLLDEDADANARRPFSEHRVADAGTPELMAEVQRRYEAAAKEAAELIGEAEKIDWSHVAGGFELHQFDSGGMFPDIEAAAEVLQLLGLLLWATTDQFDLGVFHRLDVKEPKSATKTGDPDSLKRFDLHKRIAAIRDELAKNEYAARNFDQWLWEARAGMAVEAVGQPLRMVSRAVKRSTIPARLRAALKRYRETDGKLLES